MSRLIDADKLIEDVLNSMPTGSARGVFRAFIEGQPTAFDVDKVVEELEDDKKFYSRTKFKDVQTIFIHEQIVGIYEDVIDIVKEGGINDN